MITLRGLTKRYGERTAVNGLTLEVRPGKVTGFLGPNGAGKSTTMRMILGLDAPSEGSALIGGKRYVDLVNPLREVGALLEAKAVHPGRSARGHLLAEAHTHGIPAKRVDQILEFVGLADVARKRSGSFSLGMSQRLGIACALLGDPETLILDEPVNGLDPDGVRWVRDLVRALADQGRTVFMSSHLMTEMQLVADHLVIIGKGELIADAPMAELIAKSSGQSVRFRGRDTHGVEALAARLASDSVEVTRDGALELVVRGATVERVGDLCHELGVRVRELNAAEASLEQTYMRLTAGSVEYGESDSLRAANQQEAQV
ncbi:ABC-2 type transport system ATP-binding protein [Actinokineospora alba]|uniref:ABC-2 type transport system ATP-binding protein n=1 Tax=Actinokineospora alba TaxID=504798 RepID=A0A1H0W1P7_9PSEU|nr:ABC transporter ATP-binding protein [Actinokineospora alba]TDP67759.1 ABC-2 type transport system ATP-binding protein [Actinokineospora alba]SDI71308.1 ABC-2 type transport system ATP-binding protein [Actinokineospora alba]SDP84471.1 ABC-2 type transport system ATP-binding protein [Actinokineospora alba]